MFIYNPKSGKGQIRTHLADVIERLSREGYEITIYPTGAAGEASEAAEHQTGYDLIVCSGGDGTLNEVVSGLLKGKHKTPIGYIPAGSTNDFATSLKIPKNIVKAADCAVNGKPFSCDAGMFNKNYFVYIAAFGIFTEVSYKTDQQMKNVMGYMAYILEGVLSLAQIKSYHLKYVSDEAEGEGDFLYGMVTNSRSVGGFSNIVGKGVELDDGLFEVMLIRMPKNPRELNKIISSLLQEELNSEMISWFKTSKIRFESEQKIPWTLDGEYGGRKSAVTISNLPKSMEIMVPDDGLKNTEM